MELPVFKSVFIKKSNMVTISSDIVQSTKMTDQELLVEIAVMLFEREKLTMGQAARLAGMPQFKFQHLLASREIPIHYGIEEYKEDLKTMQSLKL